jgi:hypothetical protein
VVAVVVHRTTPVLMPHLMAAATAIMAVVLEVAPLNRVWAALVAYQFLVAQEVQVL